jgi:AAA15 family ATPase/GTPase
MLLKFSVSNYLSINDKQTLELVASNSDKTSLKRHLREYKNYKLNALRTAAIFGPNASGKTNIIKAIKFMKDFINFSSKNTPTSSINAVPFKFSETDNKISSFEAEFIVKEIMYTYGFEIDNKRVHKEWLYYYPKNYRRVIFERDENQQEKYKFGSDLKGSPKTVSNMTKPNSLFLSMLSTMNEEISKDIFVFFNPSQILNEDDFINTVITKSALSKYLNNDESKFKLIKYLAEADFGIKDIKIEKNYGNIPIEPPFENESKKDDAEIVKYLSELFSEQMKFLHTHNNISKYLDASEESSGTIRFLDLLPQFLDNKGITLIDELETSLHPSLLKYLLNLYYNIFPESQLIFTSQNSDLLDTRLLRRDEIYFTEKQEKGNTCLFSLDDIKPKPRLNDNIKMRYLYGQYGAIPNID